MSASFPDDAATWPNGSTTSLHRSARDPRAEGRYERTATIYLQSIRFFGDWWAGRGDPVVVVRAGREIRVGTVRTRYKGLRRFCRWLVAEGELDSDPVLGMDVPSVVDKPVPVLTDDDLAALVKACAGKDLTGRRDEVVIRFLPDTGCRVSELCGLAVDDIDLDTE
jgi:integrase